MKQNKTYLFIGLTVLVLLFTIFSFSRFYKAIQAEELVSEQLSLQTTAKREASVGDMKIVSYFDTLRAAAEFVNDDDLLTASNMEHLEAIQSTVEFQQLGYLSLDGLLHLADGEVVDMRAHEYIEMLQQGRTSVTDTLRASGQKEDSLAIIIPVTLKNGDVMGGVFGSFSPEQLRFQDGSWARDSAVYSYVIDHTAQFVLNSAKAGNPFAEAESITERLDSEGEGISPQILLQRLRLGQDTLETLTIDGVSYIAAFSPMRFSSWYSVMLTPLDQALQYSENLLGEHLLPLILQILLAIGLFCATIIALMLRDVEQTRKKEKSLRRGLTTGIIGYLEADLDDDMVLHFSDSKILMESTGHAFSDYLKQLILRYVHPDYQENAMMQLSAANLHQLYERHITEHAVNFFVRLPEHGILWCECTTHVMQSEDNGHLMGYYSLRNITDKVSEESKLKDKAERDGLTGLYNRATAMEAINLFLQSDAHDAYAQHAFFILDLDNFKAINDTLGHKTGDTALQNVADILTDYFRRGDIICRLGGDEFVVFLKNIPSAAAEKKIQALLPRLELQYTGETEESEETVAISASIGVSYYNEGDDFKMLYQKADEALYWAKESGKNTYRVNRT